MKRITFGVIALVFIFGCSFTDPKIGTRMNNCKDYQQWVTGQPWLRFNLINLRVDDVKHHSTHDTLIMTIIKKEADGKYRSFNNTTPRGDTELDLKFYLLDENKIAYDKVHVFKRIGRFPATLEIDIPRDARLKYFSCVYGLKWYYEA